MLTTVAKRIQTKLSRKGIKQPLGVIKDYLKTNVGNIENISDSEELATTEYFLSSANQLTVIGENVDNADNADSDIDNVLTLSIQEDVEEEAIAPQTEPAPLVVSPKNELVASTADQMGIVLDASEISLIAENINHSSDDFDQDIDAIKSAIMAFVQHKSLINQSKINQMIHEVREVVSEKNSENSQLLTDGLRSINSDIQEANKQFKSNVQKCLTAFAIPAIKAS